MCRNIVKLRSETRASDEELEAAARQFVRKVSGFRQPSRVNTPVFERAVAEIASSTQRLLGNLVVRGR